MKKILIVLPNDSLGGAEQVLKMIANYFQSYLVEVKFLKCRNDGGWDDLEGIVQIKYTHSNSEYLGAFFFIINSIFSIRKRYDFIFTSHVFVTGLIGFLIRLAFLKKNKFVGRESTLIFKRFSGFKLFLYKQIYRCGYGAVDLLICQTNEMKKNLLFFQPRLKDKAIVINNPVNLSSQITTKGVKLGSPFIVSAGRLIEEKGFDILISSFKKIKKIYPTYKLLLFGEGKDRNKLQSQIITNNLVDSVTLMGFVKDIYPYFRSAELCVVSSRIEGFPNVLLQMMSQNSRVVSTICAGGIEDIEGLYTCEPNNSELLAARMEEALMQVDTSGIRMKFDLFLSKNTVEKYINKIMMHLDEK